MASSPTSRSRSGSNDSAVVREQLASLDDTDCLASAWSEAIEAVHARSEQTDKASGYVSWGGRGKGGRGRARQTYQPKDVVVDDVSLQYLEGGKPNKASKSSKKGGTSSKINGSILENSRLKLLHGHAYALIGRNGCGKSTLLRRMHAHKIPGLSPHITTLYLPQHNDEEALQIVASSQSTSIIDQTPVDVVMTYQQMTYQSSEQAIQSQIEHLEDQLESLQLSEEDGGATIGAASDDDDEELDVQQRMEDICEQISSLEDRLEPAARDVLREQAQHALQSWNIGDDLMDVPFSKLTSGQRKKVLLSVALICPTDVVLLDEPAQDLDIPGLIQLRRLIAICAQEDRTVVLVSHDVDLINDVATDIIYFSNHQLHYFPGNYNNFQTVLEQHGIQALREQVSLEKKREHMLQTLDNLKKQPIPKRGGGRKKAKQVESVKKKLERTGIQRDAKGHRWQAQKAGTGIQRGAINGLDANTRKGLSSTQLLKQAQKAIQRPPDKAVQFIFRDPPSHWGEPLITAFDLGYKPKDTNTDPEHPNEDGGEDATADSEPQTSEAPEAASSSAAEEGIGDLEAALKMFQKKPGYLFDGVDLCVEEGSKVCILGYNGVGKSSLLRLLAKAEAPTEGTIHHASGISIGYWDADLLKRRVQNHGASTSLKYLQDKYGNRTEQDLRSELTSFGLAPHQITRPIHYLSGGEQTRLALVDLMLNDPPVLLLDNPTCHLDVESVEALTYGLQRWKGTVVMVSHDASFLRVLDVQCYVLTEKEGKLRRLEGGMDMYLKHFKY